MHKRLGFTRWALSSGTPCASTGTTVRLARVGAAERVLTWKMQGRSVQRKAAGRRRPGRASGVGPHIPAPAGHPPGRPAPELEGRHDLEEALGTAIAARVR